jgi:anti-sigma-K factor RskA
LRKQAKLPHHSNIVPIRKVLDYFATEHPIHVDVLNLEGASGGLHADQHSTIDREARRAEVRAAVSAAENDPLALCDRVQSRQPRIGEVGSNLSQHFPHASTPYLSAMVSAVIGEAACSRVEVAAIESVVKLHGYTPIGIDSVQGTPPFVVTPAE